MKKEISFLPQFETKVVKYKNRDVQTYKFGEGGEVVLALPSFPHSGLYFTYLLHSTHLMNKLTFITFDLPGWAGYTDKQIYYDELNTKDLYINIVERILEEYNIEKFNLLGYSFGGAISLKVAAKLPEKVKKLILVSTVVNGTLARDTRQYRLINLANRLKLSPFVKRYILLKFQNVVSKYREGSDIPGNFWERYDDMLKHLDAKILLDSAYKLFHNDWIEELKMIDSKKILVVNSRDELPLFRDQAKFLRKYLPEEQSLYLEGTHDDFILKSKRKSVEKVLEFFLD